MHVHTCSSPDGDLSATRLCEIGRGKGVALIGFVAHLDLHPDDFCYRGFHEETYQRELDSAEEFDGPTVLRGLEIGEPHRFLHAASALYRPEKYDFITGALHWLGNSMILDKQPFLEGDPLDLVERYYEETLEMLHKGGFNILAHMGIFRRGMALAGLSCDFDETLIFPELLRDLLEKSIEMGIAIEVNTAGLRRPERATYPTRPVLRMYRDLGGTMITIGSDTHRAEHAFYGLAEGEALIRATGFTGYGYFEKRRYMATPLQ